MKTTMTTKTLTRAQLMALMVAGEVPYITLPDGRAGILDSVQREDGSGRCFNLTLNMGAGGKVTVFVRTVG